MRTVAAPNDSMAGQVVHVFEAAGLGKAPYRFLGVQTKVGPITMPDGGQVGAPGQPMGTCQYCGTGIKDCYYLRSTDGREFYVGCDCIRKAGDKSLIRYVKAEEAAKRRAKNHERNLKRWAAEAEVRKGLMAEVEAAMAEHRGALEARPHPYGFAGKSLYDYMAHCLPQAGNTRLESFIKQIKGGN